jgi:hypothetical protein
MVYIISWRPSSRVYTLVSLYLVPDRYKHNAQWIWSRSQTEIKMIGCVWVSTKSFSPSLSHNAAATTVLLFLAVLLLARTQRPGINRQTVPYDRHVCCCIGREEQTERTPWHSLICVAHILRLVCSVRFVSKSRSNALSQLISRILH